MNELQKKNPGVDFWKSRGNGRWRARYYKGGKRECHYYDTYEEAVQAYEEHYKKYPKQENPLKKSLKLTYTRILFSESGATGYVGVTQIKSGKYEARIGFRDRRYYLGIYSNLKEAIGVRKKAEEKLHDNFIDWYEETFLAENAEMKESDSKYEYYMIPNLSEW